MQNTPLRTAPQPREPMLYTAVPAGTTGYDNESLADAFTVLTHDLEWGGSRPHLVRLDSPIRVGLAGAGSQAYSSFVDDLIGLLKDRARIDIARSTASDASILIRFVPGDDFKAFSRNQCIIVGEQPSWDAFEADPARYGAKAFEESGRLDRVSAFIPNTMEPFAIRECILEEVTQALGIINDLYGLGPTIFNDDDGHTWPTRLDLLFLRVLYDPDLKTGLDREETRDRALAVLDRLNPAGRQAAPLPAIRQGRFLSWRNRLHRLLGRQARPGEERVRLAEALVIEAQELAPGSAYLCEALSARAYVVFGDGLPDALIAANDALDVCISVHGRDDVRIADLQLLRARNLRESRDFAGALAATEGLDTFFLAHGKESNLLHTLIVRENSQLSLGDVTAATATRRRLRRWAAYALGRDNALVQALGGT